MRRSVTKALLAESDYFGSVNVRDEEWRRIFEAWQTADRELAARLDAETRELYRACEGALNRLSAAEALSYYCEGFELGVACGMEHEKFCGDK